MNKAEIQKNRNEFILETDTCYSDSNYECECEFDEELTISNKQNKYLLFK